MILHSITNKMRAYIKKWPFTLFGTAVIFGIISGVGIGFYLSALAMRWRGLI